MGAIIVFVALIIMKLVIEKVCGAIKILYTPAGIRRKAKAEADALTTKEMQMSGFDKNDLKSLKREITLSRLDNP